MYTSRVPPFSSIAGLEPRAGLAKRTDERHCKKAEPWPKSRSLLIFSMPKSPALWSRGRTGADSGADKVERNYAFLALRLTGAAASLSGGS
jgi:hypothetical protein